MAWVFLQFGLVDVEIKQQQSEPVQWLGMHDSLHEFAILETEKHRESSLGHLKLIEGYGSGIEINEGCRPWWKVEDDYIRNHVTRHLLKAGSDSELVNLMLQPRWAITNMALSALLRLESDFQFASEAISGMSNREELIDNTTQMNYVLKVICRAVKLSGVSGTEPRVLCFQLYGRLLTFRGSYGAIRLYLSRVRRDAPRPWILPLTGFLESPDGPCIGICALRGIPTFLAILCEGIKYAVGCFDGHVNVVDIKGKSVISKWKAHGEIKSMAASIDGKRLWSWGGIDAFSSSTTVKLWDMETQTVIIEFGMEREIGSVCVDVECVDVSTEGQKLLCGYTNGKISLWDLDTKQIMWERQHVHEGYVRCVMWITESKTFLSGGTDGVIRLWTANSEEVVQELVGHTHFVCCLALSRSKNRVVSGSYDNTVGVWELDNGSSTGRLVGHKGIVFCVNISEDDKRIVSGSADMTVRVWDINNRSQIAILEGHGRPVLGVYFFENVDKVVSCSGDETVRIWEPSMARKSQSHPTNDDQKHKSVVLCIAISGNGKRVVSGSKDKTIRIWNTSTGKQLGEPLTGHQDHISSVAITHNGKRVFSASNLTFGVWDVGGAHRFINVQYECSAIAVTPSGDCAVVCVAYVDSENMRGKVCTWYVSNDLNDIPSDASATLEDGLDDYILRAYTSADNKRAICYSHAQVRVWDLNTHAVLQEVPRANLISRHDVLHAIGENDTVAHLHCSANEIFWVDGDRTLVAGLDTSCSVYYYDESRELLCIGMEDGHVAFCRLDNSPVNESSSAIPSHPLRRLRNCIIA